MKLTAPQALLLAAALLPGCINSAPESREVPAIIPAPDEASRDELLRAVRGILDNRQLTLSGDALRNSSDLVIERRHLLGRDPGRAELFQLVVRDGQCLLRHQRSGTTVILQETRCEPQAAPPTGGESP